MEKERNKSKMYYDNLNSEMQVSYLIRPILETLKEAGGQLERSEIRDRISEKMKILRSLNKKFISQRKKVQNIKNLTLNLILL